MVKLIYYRLHTVCGELTSFLNLFRLAMLALPDFNPEISSFLLRRIAIRMRMTTHKQPITAMTLASLKPDWFSMTPFSELADGDVDVTAKAAAVPSDAVLFVGIIYVMFADVFECLKVVVCVVENDNGGGVFGDVASVVVAMFGVGGVGVGDIVVGTVAVVDARWWVVVAMGCVVIDSDMILEKGAVFVSFKPARMVVFCSVVALIFVVDPNMSKPIGDND